MFGKVKLECTSNEHRLLCNRENVMCEIVWDGDDEKSSDSQLLIWFDDVWNVRDNWMINLWKSMVKIVDFLRWRILVGSRAENGKREKRQRMRGREK